MRKIFKNKKGMGLPIILAITSFFIVSVLSLITVLMYQSKAQAADFNYQQEYIISQRKIDATANSIIINEDMTSDFLADLSTFMDVEIIQSSASTIKITRGLSNGSEVKSYLANANETISLMGEYFDYDGLENNFEINPLLTPALLLENYLDEFFDINFPAVEFNTGFTDINAIVTYIRSIAQTSGNYIEVDESVLTGSSNPVVNGHWYIDGNVTFGDNIDLTVLSGYTLFIDGNLTLKKSGDLTGNVIVNGDVIVDARKSTNTFEGTVYMSGDFKTSDNTYLGTSSRPTFVFSEGLINFKKVVSGYGYLLSTGKEVAADRKASVSIIGGIYANSTKNIDAADVSPNPSLNEEDLYDFAVSAYLTFSSSVNGGYIYTDPK